MFEVIFLSVVPMYFVTLVCEILLLSKLNLTDCNCGKRGRGSSRDNSFCCVQQRVFSSLRQETHVEFYYLARWFNLSRQIAQPIASPVVTDACQTIDHFHDYRHFGFDIIMQISHAAVRGQTLK